MHVVSISAMCPSIQCLRPLLQKYPDDLDKAAEFAMSSLQVQRGVPLWLAHCNNTSRIVLAVLVKCSASCHQVLAFVARSSDLLYLFCEADVGMSIRERYVCEIMT